MNSASGASGESLPAENLSALNKVCPDLPTAPAQRYIAVDSLRGIASLFVAIDHLSSPAFAGASGAVADWLLSVFKFGYLGVPIFFVISGFVITATVNPRDVDFGYIGKFIAKRAVRLDPPYWLSMVCDIGLIYLTANLLHFSATPMPSLAKIAAHLIYAQDLLGFGNISAIYWTLCLEVQFYIFLTLIFAVSKKVAAAFPVAISENYLIVGLGFVSVFWSALVGAHIIENPITGLFLSHWYLFALGALCRWSTAGARRFGSVTFLAYCVSMFGLFMWQQRFGLGFALNTGVALITAIFLYAAAVRKKMGVWLNYRPLVYLGSLSYSLYLFHGIVGERFIAIMQKLVMPRVGLLSDSALYSITLLAVSIGGSIAAAHIVYRFVELPTVKLSKRIKPALKGPIFGVAPAAAAQSS